MVEKEAQKVAADFGQPRRSQLLSAPNGGDSLTDISVIANEPNIIVVSKRGFIKRMPANTIEVQNRNGRGVQFSLCCVPVQHTTAQSAFPGVFCTCVQQCPGCTLLISQHMRPGNR